MAPPPSLHALPRAPRRLCRTHRAHPTSRSLPCSRAPEYDALSTVDRSARESVQYRLIGIASCALLCLQGFPILTLATLVEVRMAPAHLRLERAHDIVCSEVCPFFSQHDLEGNIESKSPSSAASSGGFADTPLAIALATSCDSSSRYGTSDSGVCAASHGQFRRRKRTRSSARSRVGAEGVAGASFGCDVIGRGLY